MTLKLTDRDKKLLTILAVVLLLAGLGGRVILPLLDAMSQTQEEITEAQIEKAEKEIKVDGLEGIKKAAADLAQELERESEKYHKTLLSKDVDEILTSKALSYGATVKGLSISMPSAGTGAMLAPYGGRLSGEQDAVDQTTYSGFSAAEALLQVTGERSALQGLLDDLFSQTPALRVDAFQWGQDSQKAALSVYLEIYMMKDMENHSEEN